VTACSCGIIAIDPFAPDSVVDHDGAFSVYFSDPYGKRLGVATYDCDASRAGVTALRGRVR
jgi:hypothetical protein